ncbi:MAG: DUF2285 domain-containing protein [Emcibacter sp.]|nr:DUF2285 domain-containing protein [Emcibacter sp.]
MSVVAPRNNGGYLNFVNPDLDSTKASPFWNSELCPHIMHADFHTDRHRVEPYVLNLNELNCQTLTLRQCPNLIHYMFQDGHKSIQICCQDTAGRYAVDKQCGDLCLVFQTGNNIDTSEERLAKKRLQYLAKKGCLPDHLFKANVASLKFKRQLEVIQQVIQNIADKQIAELFFEKDRIMEEWPIPDSHVRNIVEYAIEAAENLMSGDYLKYLSVPDS